MAKTSAKQSPKGSAPKLPLSLRLKAWWEGYDVDEVARRYQARMAAHGTQQDGSGDAGASESQEFETRDVDEGTGGPPAASANWSQAKIDVAQYIWGEGYCGPGGPDYIVALSKLMALSPEMSMLQIGCALGGPARVLVERFGVWITGYDESPDLVRVGNELSEKLGMKRKAQLTTYDLDNFEGFDRKYDRALSKEALFTLKNKRAMIEAIEDKLKPGGLFLATDLVLAQENAVASDDYRAWKVGERSTPHMVTADELSGMFKHARLQVRVSEDISDTYIKMINDAWVGADDVAAALAKEPDGAEKVQVLMNEAQFWTRRKKMLESGKLRLWRIVANKKAAGPSMMSDW